MYWHYDAIADSWDLTADRSQENGRLADVDGDGFFDLALDPIYPTVAATLAAARRGGTDILIY
jgi:hypothetical protein